jgi:Patatin-like phospholipase
MSKYLPYLYLARFPALTGLLLVALGPVSLFSGLESLLRGLFDLTPWGMFFMALGSLLGSWTAMIAFWIVAAYGWRRFGVQPIGVCFPPNCKATVWFGILAAPLWIAGLYESHRGLGSIFGLIAGLIVAVLILWIVERASRQDYFQGVALPEIIRKRARQHAAQGVLPEEHRGKASPGLGAGYVEEGGSSDFPVLRGHGLASAMFVASVIVYLGVGLLKVLMPGEHLAVPSIAYVLLLVMVSCWGLSGAAFFLDRYRVPLILPVGLWWLVTSQIFGSDHYYLIRSGTRQTISPAELIARGKTGRVIVVATTGGGIQAAGWTAEVIEGLEQKCRESTAAACVGDRKIFGKSLRLISSVSGGSTGSLYLVNEYDANGGGLPDVLGTAFSEATKSSLDDVAWGLVYPDFARTLVPIPWRFDRGWALEQAWQANRADGQPDLRRGYSVWRDGVNQGTLPGLIFNSTVTETGQRLLLNTAGIETKGEATKTFNQLGEKENDYQNKDLAMTTAARLSASFTYVTPVARSEGDRGHMADGGYYDNYGMSTLIQWLRQALPSKAPPVNDVMVIQIRAFPPDRLRDKPRRGWLYQAIAPLDALLDVRTAGQYAHNRDEFDLLQDATKASVQVYTSVFEFCGTDPPLSWHLEQRDIDEMKREWKTEQIDREWKKVERFLDRKSLREDIPEPPLDSFCKK